LNARIDKGAVDRDVVDRGVIGGVGIVGVSKYAVLAGVASIVGVFCVMYSPYGGVLEYHAVDPIKPGFLYYVYVHTLY
jgi:hypothetical protein